MKVLVVGKRNVSGTDKNGQSYSYCIAHVTYSVSVVEGSAVEQVRLYDRVIRPEKVFLDSYYNLDRDSNGAIIDFSYIGSAE